MLTLNELKEKLAEQVDEVDLIQILGITSYDLVNAFDEIIEENYDRLMQELELGEYFPED
jgi:hypothetical protein|tara:strand:- start:5128 stop:5307 length:180 start_codon:yes stop_codon:yes gene_type:complete